MPPCAPEADGARPEGSRAKAFRRGVASDLLNVKVGLFWTALVPQFVSADTSDGANGRELWKSDGTAAGTVMVNLVGSFNLTGAGEPERLQGARTTASLFSVLRATPLIGNQEAGTRRRHAFSARVGRRAGQSAIDSG